MAAQPGGGLSLLHRQLSPRRWLRRRCRRGAGRTAQEGLKRAFAALSGAPFDPTARSVTNPRFSFSIAATDGKARTGAIQMRRGEIRTPAFMPVGPAATVTAMRPAEVRAGIGRASCRERVCQYV